MIRETVNSHEAASLLEVSTATLRLWRGRNYGPAYHRVGRRIRYRREDLEAFLAGARVQPSASFEAALTRA